MPGGGHGCDIFTDLLAARIIDGSRSGNFPGEVLVRFMHYGLLTSWLLLTMVACVPSPSSQPVENVELPDSDQARDICVEVAMDQSETVYLNHRRLGADWEKRISRAIRSATAELYLPVTRGGDRILELQSRRPMIRLRLDRRLTYAQINPVLTVCARNHVHMVGLITGRGKRTDDPDRDLAPDGFSGLAVRLFSYHEVLGPNAAANKFAPICIFIESGGRVKVNWHELPISELTTWAKTAWPDSLDRRLYVIPGDRELYDTVIETLSRVLAGNALDLRLVRSEERHYLQFLMSPPLGEMERQSKARGR